MPSMPMTVTLERAAATRAPQSYDWRFPAEFRTRPVGWTERGQPREPASSKAGDGQKESSVGLALPAGLALERGPDSLMAAPRTVSLGEASNQPPSAPAPLLSFAPTRGHPLPDAVPDAVPNAAPGTVSGTRQHAQPPLLDYGPPCLLAAPLAPHEAASNAGATRSLELDILPVRTPAATPPPSALSIGNPSLWSQHHPAPSAAALRANAANEASYAY